MPNVGLLLAHRLRRWANSKPTLGQRLMFAGMAYRLDDPNQHGNALPIAGVGLHKLAAIEKKPISLYALCITITL